MENLNKKTQTQSLSNNHLVRTNSISETLGIVDKQLITKIIIT